MFKWVFPVKPQKPLEQLAEEEHYRSRLRALAYDASNKPEHAKAAVEALEKILGGKDGTTGKGKVEGPSEEEISRLPRCVR